MQQARETTRHDIWIVGGAVSMQSALEDGLVDLIEIFLVPVLLGAGLNLLNDLSRRPTLIFDGIEAFPDGVVKLRYLVPRLATRHKADSRRACMWAAAPLRRGPAWEASRRMASVQDARQLSSRILNLRPPLGVSVTVALMPAGSVPTYSGRKRRNSSDSASAFSTWLMAPPMQARLPPPNGR